MIFQYEGLAGCESQCDIVIFRYPNLTVVVCAERHDNPGTEISDTTQNIATQVCNEHSIPHDQVVWLEHRPTGTLAKSGVPVSKPIWDLVTLQSDGKRFLRNSVRWSEIEPHEAHAIIAGVRPTSIQYERNLHTGPTGPSAWDSQ